VTKEKTMFYDISISSIEVEGRQTALKECGRL